MLRILRGVYPEGHPRCEIAQRMVERAPDVTRLVDRLQSQGLVRRNRSSVRSTPGHHPNHPERLKLLECIQPDLEQQNTLLMRDLGDKESTNSAGCAR